MPIKFSKGMNIFLENQNIISSLYGSPCSIYYEGGAIAGVAIDFHVPSSSKISFLFFVDEFIYIYLLFVWRTILLSSMQNGTHTSYL